MVCLLFLCCLWMYLLLMRCWFSSSLMPVHPYVPHHQVSLSLCQQQSDNTLSQLHAQHYYSQQQHPQYQPTQQPPQQQYQTQAMLQMPAGSSPEVQQLMMIMALQQQVSYNVTWNPKSAVCSMQQAPSVQCDHQ